MSIKTSKYRSFEIINKELEFNLEEDTNVFSLKQLVINNDKIVLIGNPGMGKTYEFKNLFSDLWKEKEKTGLIPLILNIKKINIDEDDFEGYIKYKEWKLLPSIIFIIDGLDEIPSIEIFIAKLNIFIAKYENLNLKFVISCRTNVYELYKNSFFSFNVVRLLKLNSNQAIKILKKTHKINIDFRKLNDYQKIYLESPFFLNLFANYYLKNNNLPNNYSKIWEDYIEVLIDMIPNQFSKNKKNQLIKNLTKCALIIELTQKNCIQLTELQIVLKNEYKDFLRNPFMERILMSDNLWGFTHRQIQEYFFAKKLSYKNFEQIKSILLIGENKKYISKSLYNITFFLFELIKGKKIKFKKFYDLLYSIEPEIIIKLNLTEFKKDQIKLFQSYFTEKCIIKGYWFGTNNTVTEEEFARFGDCDENAEFLIQYIIKENTHFRVQLSAINILKEFNLSEDKFEQIKIIFFDILKSEEKQNAELKSSIIYFFKNYIDKKPLLKEDLTNFLFTTLMNISDKSINRALLGLIESEKNIDQYFEFIKKEFEFEFKIKERENDDEVFRGNDWILKELILRFKNFEYFIPFAIYFCDDYNFRYDDYLEKLIDKIAFFDKNNPTFFYKFIEAFIESEHKNKRFSEDILFSILSKLNRFDEGFDLFFDVKRFYERIHFLGRICTSDRIQIVIDNYSELNDINDTSIRSFRNILSNSNYNLAYQFQQKTIELGYDYKSDLLKTKEEVDAKKLEIEKFSILNFDTLFIETLLIEKIEKVFEENESKILNKEIIFNLQNQYHDIHGWFFELPIEIEILYSLSIKNQYNFDLPKAIEWIKIPLFKLEFIKRYLEKENKKSLELDSSKISYIQKLCNELVGSVEFNNVIHQESSKSFSYSNHYSSIKVILFYYLKYDIKIDKDFLLNTITYFELEKTEIDPFYKYLDKIQENESISLEQINNKILNDFKEGNLTRFMFNKHISYVLDHDLTDGYSDIEVYYLSTDDVFSGDHNFELFLSRIDNNSLLNKLLEKEDKYVCWSAVKFILSDTELKQKFQSKICDLSLRTLQISETLFSDNALRSLFQLNHPDALNYIIENYKKSITRSVPVNYFLNYDVLKDNDYQIVSDLLNSLFSLSKDGFEFSNANTFVTTYLSNLSKIESHYYAISELLKTMLSEEKEKMKATDDDELIKKSDFKCFYLNLFLDSIENSYLNMLSKPLDFKEALAKANQIIGA